MDAEPEAYLDTESVGFVGPTVLVQHAFGDGPIVLLDVFETPIKDTLALIARLVACRGVVMFNATHDWFHVARLYNVLTRMIRKGANPSLPPTAVGWFANLGYDPSDMCVKPRSVLDLMLYARKGPMQSLMERDDVRLRRIPAILAEPLAELLTSRLKLPSIYFARREDGSAWKVEKDPDDPDFPGVYLKFAASGGLKPLARHLLGVETIGYPHELEDSLPPVWDLHASFYTGIVHRHVAFWKLTQRARAYAAQDVDLLRRLRGFWGNPPLGDTDSLLACKVGTCRWRGWGVDTDKLRTLHDQATIDMDAAPRAPKTVLYELHQRLSEEERLVVEDTTAHTLGVVSKLGGPAGAFADTVITARSAEKRKDLAGKLLHVGRAHFDMKVIGALSGRSSGAGGINLHGIERGEMRDAFYLDEGGDFKGFEVTISAAVYDDPAFNAYLAAGNSVHVAFGSALFNVDESLVKQSGNERGDKQVKVTSKQARGDERSNAHVMLDEGEEDNVEGYLLGDDGDIYNPTKRSVFAYIYGAQAPKIAATTKLPVETVEEGMERFFSRFPGIKAGKQRDEDLFCSMRQPGGIGTRVVWHEPVDKVETLLGHPRYYTLENTLCKFLFDLAQDPPRDLLDDPALKDVKVRRRDRVQTPGGALRSALYAAAFQIQARSMRSGGNHRIQGTGAGITKELERAVWDHQPAGIHPYRVSPFNVHDEVVTDKMDTSLDLEPTVHGVVERFKKVVPLLGLDWKTSIKRWGNLK